MPYLIRRAQHADLGRLADLLLALQDHIEAANPDLWRLNAEARHNLKGQLAGRLRAEDSLALVAEHESEGIIGVIFGRVVVNNRYTPPQAGQIDQAFVHPDHRRRGVGKQLVAELCRFFDARAVGDISLRYAVGNSEAVRFWQDLGFKPRIVTAGVSLETLRQRAATAPR